MTGSISMVETISGNAREADAIDVSFVIVSWNVAELLGKCIQSIVNDAGAFSIEVFVVDNASRDHTVEMLREKFPWVQLIANTENVGFARANNQALRRLRGRYVFILNPDTVLVQGALQKMVEDMRSRPEVGMSGPCVVHPDGEVQKTCARLLPTLTSSLLSECLGLFELPVLGSWLSKRYSFPYDYGVSQRVQAVSGAAIFLRREVIDTVGGFGECFMHCGEDVDLCFRAEVKGWTIRYVYDARVVHYGGESTKQVPVRIWANATLSKEMYYRRCFSRVHARGYKMMVYAVWLPTMIIVGSAKLMLGMESPKEFRVRLRTARGVYQWREIQP